MPFSLPLLQQREIEANAIAPFYRAIVAEVGVDRAREILQGVIHKLAHQSGCAAAIIAGGQQMSQLKQTIDKWSEDGALELTVLRDDGTVYEFHVTRCQFAEMYHRLGLADLGPLLSCGRDAAMVEGFNQNIAFSRTQTIMDGAEFCNFRYEMKGCGSEMS